MTRQEQIKHALENAFDVIEIEVVDDSESHRGHSGYQEGGESHFNVRLVTRDFMGKSRIARHRSVHAALGSELLGQIHALALDLSAPEA